MKTTMSFPDTIVCRRDVVMDGTKEIAFTQGKTYVARIGHYINAINNFEEEHCLGTMNDKDKFFHKHFLKTY